ncbi:hypothetical protein [Gordonia alkanivorans]|uniref:hypothetical protein n=1 Tax=Gordonia alkanivorans TaxID=84096 RepID=UPI0004B82D16|nr:hypothetical protein [Gordonia alkanivorans]
MTTIAVPDANAGVKITYGVMFTDDGGKETVDVTNDRGLPLDCSSVAATHALHLRAIGYCDAHVVQDFAGHVGWQAMRHAPTSLGHDIAEPDEAARLIARVLGEHTDAQIDDDSAAVIAYLAVRLAEHAADNEH